MTIWVIDYACVEGGITITDKNYFTTWTFVKFAEEIPSTYLSEEYNNHKYQTIYLTLGRYDAIFERKVKTISIGDEMITSPLYREIKYWDIVHLFGSEIKSRDSKKDWSNQPISFCFLRIRTKKDLFFKRLTQLIVNKFIKKNSEYDYSLFELYGGQDCLMLLKGSPMDILLFIKEEIHGANYRISNYLLNRILLESSTMLGVIFSPQFISDDKNLELMGEISFSMAIKISPGKHHVVKSKIRKIMQCGDDQINWALGWFDLNLRGKTDFNKLIKGMIELRKIPEIITTTTSLLEK